MTEPTDPNEPRGYDAPPPYQPPSYQPPSYPPPSYQPPGFHQTSEPYPPAPGSPPPAYQPPAYGAPAGGWMGPDGQWVPVDAPAPRSSGKRNVIVAVVAVVVLAAAGVGAYFLFRGDDKSGSGTAKRTAVPSSFAGYSSLDSPAADQVKTSIRQMGSSIGGGASARLFAAATIGVYSHDSGDQPVLISLTVPTSAAGGGHTPAQITQQMLSSAVPSSTDFPSGSHGGSTRCGSTQFGAVSETMCSWSDEHDSGLLISVRESLSPTRLADVTRSFRDAVE